MFSWNFFQRVKISEEKNKQNLTSTKNVLRGKIIVYLFKLIFSLRYSVYKEQRVYP